MRASFLICFQTSVKKSTSYNCFGKITTSENNNKFWKYFLSYVTLPTRPSDTSTSSNPFLFTAGDQLVVPIGASHISLPLQEIQSREWEKKEQTNKMLGLTQVQKRSYVTLCICRLTLAWISSENSTTLLECQPILTGLHSLVWTLSHADSSFCCPVSTGHSRHPSPNCLPRAPLSNSLLVFPYPLPVTRDLESKTLCLVSRQNKGIICLADHQHSVTDISSSLEDTIYVKTLLLGLS